MSWYEKAAAITTVGLLVGFAALLVWDALGPRNLGRLVDRLVQ